MSPQLPEYEGGVRTGVDTFPRSPRWGLLQP